MLRRFLLWALRVIERDRTRNHGTYATDPARNRTEEYSLTFMREEGRHASS
jgi:hypothetical protein